MGKTKEVSRVTGAVSIIVTAHVRFAGIRLCLLWVLASGSFIHAFHLRINIPTS